MILIEFRENDYLLSKQVLSKCKLAAKGITTWRVGDTIFSTGLDYGMMRYLGDSA